MTKQPKALRLAVILELRRMDIDAYAKTDLDAAAELRRLHEVNVELLAALKALNDGCRDHRCTGLLLGLDLARIAIAKATGETE